MDLDAAFFTRSRQAQAHDDDEEGDMSDAALLKRKREERSQRAAARASAKEDAKARENQAGRRYVADALSFLARDSTVTFCRLATGPLTNLALGDPSHDTETRPAAPALRSRSTSTLASAAAAIFRAETSGAFPPARSPSARHLSFSAALARKVHQPDL